MARPSVRAVVSEPSPSCLGQPTPAAWKACLPLLETVRPEVLKPALQHVGVHMGGGVVAAADFVALCADTHSDPDHLACLYAGVFEVMAIAVRKKISPDLLKNDLERCYKQVKPKVAAAIAKAYLDNMAAMEAAVEHDRVAFPHLDGMRWRVDVHISTASLSRVLKPSITLQMIFDDGSVSTFEVSPEKFQELRFTVALLLSEMQKMEGLTVMKQADVQKKKAAIKIAAKFVATLAGHHMHGGKMAAARWVKHP